MIVFNNTLYCLFFLFLRWFQLSLQMDFDCFILCVSVIRRIDFRLRFAWFFVSIVFLMMFKSMWMHVVTETVTKVLSDGGNKRMNSSKIFKDYFFNKGFQCSILDLRITCFFIIFFPKSHIFLQFMSLWSVCNLYSHIFQEQVFPRVQRNTLVIGSICEHFGVEEKHHNEYLFK